MLLRQSSVVLLAGWLFADLLLGLTIIFLAALPAKPLEAPTLLVNTSQVTKKASDCTPTRNIPVCMISITVSESQTSLGPLTWHVSSDVSKSVVFSPTSTTLLPGKGQRVAISALPCQYGSITFIGVGNNHLQVQPVTVGWQCTTPIKRLSLIRHPIILTVDYQGLLNGDQNAIAATKNQIKNQSILQGQNVGFAIVYDGAPTDGDLQQADQVDSKIYSILQNIGGAFQDASFYSDNPLFVLGSEPNLVVIDMYFFTEEG